MNDSTSQSIHSFNISTIDHLAVALMYKLPTFAEIIQHFLSAQLFNDIAFACTCCILHLSAMYTKTMYGHNLIIGREMFILWCFTGSLVLHAMDRHTSRHCYFRCLGQKLDFTRPSFCNLDPKSSESKYVEELFTFFDVRSSNRIIVMVILELSLRENRSI